MKLYPLLACALVIPSTLTAEDFTVKEAPFKKEATLKAVFIPSQFKTIRIHPKSWTDFTITTVAKQGATVKKGDTLIGIDTEKLDRHIEKIEKEAKAAALTLTQTKFELAQLEISTPLSLENKARAEKEATENLKWYAEIGQPKEIKEIKNAVLKSEQSLSYLEEELKQLLKMYNEDKKIEETEEIILTRTRNSIAHTKAALESTRINAKHALETSIQRKLVSHQLSAKNAQLANAAAKEKLPRELEQKRLAVAKAIRDDAKSKETLAKLKADRAMMNITAPVDGIVYYGEFSKGIWNAATASKILFEGGKLKSLTTVMSVIPTGTPLQLSAFAEEANLSNLKPKANGYGITNLNLYEGFPVTLTSIDTYPATDGKFHVTLKPTIPGSQKVVPGMKATVHITSKNLAKTLKVPAKFLTRGDDGTYTVKVKLADGKTEKRKVSIGANNKEWVVITQGLDKGQVIVK